MVVGMPSNVNGSLVGVVTVMVGMVAVLLQHLDIISRITRLRGGQHSQQCHDCEGLGKCLERRRASSSRGAAEFRKPQTWAGLEQKLHHPHEIRTGNGCVLVWADLMRVGRVDRAWSNLTWLGGRLLEALYYWFLLKQARFHDDRVE